MSEEGVSIPRLRSSAAREKRVLRAFGPFLFDSILPTDTGGIDCPYIKKSVALKEWAERSLGFGQNRGLNREK
mgnify:CR=1 FL=1